MAVTFYFNWWSAIDLLLRSGVLVFMVWAAAGSSTFSSLAPDPGRSIYDRPQASGVRAGWLPYWLIFGLVAGGLVRAFCAPSNTGYAWLLAIVIGGLLGLLLGAIFGGRYRSNGGKGTGRLTLVLSVGAGVGWWLGFTVTSLGWLILSAAATMALACLALMLRRPEQSGLPSKA